MEANGLTGRTFSGMGTGMLGLEMQLQPPHHHPPPQNSQNRHHLHKPQMVAFAQHEVDHHPQSHAQQSGKHRYPHATTSASKAKQPSPLSDDDDPGFTGDDSPGDGKRKISPWQRMKWTDNMVRLLILAVYYIGDEAGSEGTNLTSKKKPGSLLQKKGKWKSVSMAMMEKGFYVSPQQCEDKFNDLNKRYKRVNDILGKGTACKVVENESLLDTMDLSPKMKEEVRKLLNSKHLFFREMCAYHNSCGHNSTGVASGTNYSPEGAVEPSHTQHQQERCLHSTENAQIMENSSRARTEISKMGKRVRGEEEEENDNDESDEDQDEDEDEDEDDEEEAEGGNGSNQNEHEDEDDHDKRSSRKRPRREGLSASIQQLNCEVISVLQDGGKTPWEKSQWIKLRLMHLEEQRVNHQHQAFEIEKQRLKWLKFSSKKDREMERAKLENQQRRLENERMMLVVRQKETELLEIQHHHPQQQQQHSPNKRNDPSSVTG